LPPRTDHSRTWLIRGLAHIRNLGSKEANAPKSVRARAKIRLRTTPTKLRVKGDDAELKAEIAENRITADIRGLKARMAEVGPVQRRAC